MTEKNVVCVRLGSLSTGGTKTQLGTGIQAIKVIFWYRFWLHYSYVWRIYIHTYTAYIYICKWEQQPLYVGTDITCLDFIGNSGKALLWISVEFELLYYVRTERLWGNVNLGWIHFGLWDGLESIRVKSRMLYFKHELFLLNLLCLNTWLSSW